MDVYCVNKMVDLLSKLLLAALVYDFAHANSPNTQSEYFPFFGLQLLSIHKVKRIMKQEKVRFVRTVDYIRNFVFVCDFKVKNVRVEVEQKQTQMRVTHFQFPRKDSLCATDDKIMMKIHSK